MNISRRSFLEQSAFGAAALAVLGYAPGSMAWTSALRRAANIKIGGPDWSLRLEGKIEAFVTAKESSLDGVQVSLGKNKPGEEKLPLCDAEKQKQWLEESKKTGMPIGGTCLEILHRDNLKEHADGPK